MPKVKKKTLNLRGNVLDLTTPVVMGILNVTTDSFYANSRVLSVDQAVEQAGIMISEGAALLDIGGYSTRPGAADIGSQEESERILPIIEALRKAFSNVWLSVDTFRASVTRQAVEAGAVLVNDVSGGTLDPQMFETVADLNVPYVLMHMRGTPQTMTQHTAYQNLIPDILFETQMQLAKLRALGQNDVLIDPGFGFAKTPAQNFQVLNQLEAFQTFGAPLLVGLSRKSTIWRTLNIQPAEALNGTTVLNTIALTKGADILRVHDVREAVEVIQLVSHCRSAA
ncbi:dihydropteroate synthase [Larkinella terrae]|uniref:dihydropteroate synthase n=1 Tax=Larkinella terrae TaxID=2025311 RepID=A0A7K0EPN0_9BACT|nr:dihydropteroate synthase [Larkinella terrae]MRS63757.1 dihydropteroate synthase [Larkinella terrae]